MKVQRIGLLPTRSTHCLALVVPMGYKCNLDQNGYRRDR